VHHYAIFTSGYDTSLHLRKLQVLHTHYLRTASVIQKEVLRVETDHVVVDDRNINFDYLIINSGSTYPNIKKEQGINRKGDIKKYKDGGRREKIQEES
jgi:NADH dehydrogenase FAD-containing subunit